MHLSLDYARRIVLIFRGENSMPTKKPKNKLLIKEKIEHALDELRVVIPGTEVLLGFQFSAFFTEGFAKLPLSLRYLHLISLGFILICIMLLMTPVAYHQIVDKGEDTERFHGFVSKILVMTLIFLGLGLATEVYVVTEITTKSNQLALYASLILLIIFYLFWFGFTLFKRKGK